MKEGDGTPPTDFKGVPEAPQEKKAKGPEEDTKGAGGTEQAGTGTDAGQVPDRKDRADQMVKPKNYSEQDAPEPPKEGDEEEDLDVDKKVEEAAGAGAVPPPSKQSGMGGEGDDEDVYNEESLDLEEAFEHFKEEIEKGDAEEEDEKEKKDE